MESNNKSVMWVIGAAIIGGFVVYLFFVSPKSPKTEIISEHVFLNVADLKWVDAPATIPKGAKIVVVEGDPSKAGPFTMRLQLPANYTIAPHFHPAVEHVTVLSGTFYLGQGSTFNESDLKSLPIGGFAVMQPGMHHFAQTKNTGAILQLHGVGPWGLTYINPADDPRQANQ